MAETSATVPTKKRTRGPNKKARGPGRPKLADTGSTVSSSRSRTHITLTLPRETAADLYHHIGEMLIGQGST